MATVSWDHDDSLPPNPADGYHISSEQSEAENQYGGIMKRIKDGRNKLKVLIFFSNKKGVDIPLCGCQSYACSDAKRFKMLEKMY